MPQISHHSPIQNVLPELNRVLILGNGGRENALAWTMSHSDNIKETFVLPGNGGSEDLLNCKRIQQDPNDIDLLIRTILTLQIDLVVIGPEAHLAAGIANKLRDANINVFGPGAEGAKLESSKEWAKELMKDSNIPTANYWPTNDLNSALSILKKLKQPLVVKVNGLAGGKGVLVPETIKDTELAIREAFKGKFGIAGKTVLLEEKLYGPEVSVFALTDGKKFIILPPAQDHKRLFDGDKGPNTGGMGAYAPAALLNQSQLEEIEEIILKPTLEGLKQKGIDYRGVIYAGLMITSTGPKVIEYNCRFGDPECQALMPLLGPEFPRILQACALGDIDKAPKLSIKKECSTCIVAAAYGYPENPRQGDLLEINIQPSKYFQIFHSGTEKDSKGNVRTSGGRVLSVVAQGENFEQAFNDAYKGIKRINYPGIHYREDIGYQVREPKVLDPKNY